MKKELIEKKKELENQLIKINEEINLELIREDLKELQDINYQLDILFKNKIVDKYGYNTYSSAKAPVFIFNAMQILIDSYAQLLQDVKDIEIELNSKKN